MTRWLLISGDFTPLGGMDRANHALAIHLAHRSSAEVHLVTHRAWDDLEQHPAVTVHRVARPGNSHLAGAPLLAAAGARWARRLRGAGTRIVANGGNADVADVCWIHYVHAAFTPVAAGSAARREKTRLAHLYYARREARVLPRARLVICNSRRTTDDVVDRLGVAAARVKTIYYGTDASLLEYVPEAQRRVARRSLGWPEDRRVALFVGALGDRRKGFDRLFDAWRRLASEPRWDVDLTVAGEGGELDAWRDRARAAGLGGRVRFLGFRTDVPLILAASDLLVHPARYEAYGLGVHEAICRGIPALVSANAGVAETYPEDLHDLLLRDVENVDELCETLRWWRADAPAIAARVRRFSDHLRARSWDDMAAEIVRTVE